MTIEDIRTLFFRRQEPKEEPLDKVEYVREVNERRAAKGEQPLMPSWIWRV